MAFSLYIDESCVSTSCTYVEYSSGYLQWNDKDGGGDYVGTIYRDNDSSKAFTYSGPNDLYLTTTYSPGSGGGGSNPSNPGGGTSQNTAWSATIEYYINNVKTSFFDGNNAFPTSISNVEWIRATKYSTLGVIIEYKNWGGTQSDYTIKAPTGLKYSSISGATIGTTHYSSNKASLIKIYFTKDTSKTYTVSVTASPSEGGTVSKSPTTTHYYSDQVTVSASAKTGYTFNKWNISNLGSGEKTTSSCTFYVINNHACTAYFTPKTYTITLNKNGGSSSQSRVKIKYGTSSFLNASTLASTTITTPTRTGYTFNGWYTASSGGSLIIDTSGKLKSDVSGYTDSSSLWVKAANTTVYARWTPKTYNITYYDKGGSTFSGTHASGYPTTHTYGTATTLKNPTKTGYTFGGWYTSSACTGTAITSLSATGYTNNITLYAKWTANTVTITWNANGGSVSPTSSSYTYDGASVTLPTPSRTGYSFGGWYTAASGGTRITGIGGSYTKPTANVTYYAHWSIISYTINYYIDGVKDTSLGNPSSYTVTTSTITLKNPSKSNYTGSGWRLNSTSGTQYTQIATGSTGNKNFYWAWTPNSYNIIYKDKGDSTFSGTHASGYPTKHTYDTETALKSPTKTGYTFGGWYLDSDCKDNKVISLSATGYTSAITLYAKWTINTYTITYNLSGGTGTMTPTSYTVETATISLPTPTRTGYTFKGWYGNNQYSGSQITQISKGSTGNKQFWAKWEGNACTVTVNANPSDLTSRLSGGGNYKNGDSVTIKAPSEYGVYKFEEWTKGGVYVTSDPQYTFTANGNETYVANFIDNRKSALFKIYVLDDSYAVTGSCKVEIRYGDLDNPGENTITRAGNTTIEITGPSSTCSVIKTHISGTNFLDNLSGSASSGFYTFPNSLNNEPFINILYNGNSAESTYTADSLEFEVYYGKMPKPSTGGGGSNPGGGTDTETDNKELTVRFKYYLDGTEIDTSNGTYISWPRSNVDELKCYWFKYDGIQENDRESAISGYTDRINFTYIPEYYGDPANSTPISNLKNSLELEAPMLTHLASPTFLTGVDIHNTDKTYTYADCSNNILDIDVYFESYEFKAYVYSNLPEYGDAYIAQKGTKQAPFYASSVNPTTLRFDAEVLNNAFYFNRWVNYNTKVGLSTDNPWVINYPKGEDYHVEAEFLGRQINIKLDPNNGKTEAFWQRVGIVAGTNKFKKISFDTDEPIKYPDAKTGYEFLGWYTSETNGNGSGNLIIDKNGVLQANVPGWTSSDGLWIKGPDEVSPGLIADVVVYAKWKPAEYTITYYDKGGAAFSGNNSSSLPKKHTYGTTTTLVNGTKTGYTFNGWYTSSDCSGSAIKTIGATAYTGNITLYAKWTPNVYTITYKDKGGSAFSGNNSGSLPSKHTYGTATTLVDGTKTGYTFNGWYTSSDCSGSAIKTIGATAYTGNITLYAKWTAKIITITWDPNGGSVSPTTSTYTYDGAAVTLPTPTRTGYTFDGWYTTASGGTKIIGIGGSNTKPSTSVTYYAHWKANSYSIIYKDQGGTTFSGNNLSSLPSTHTYGTTTTLVNGTKTGYTFGGWYTSSDCSGSAIKTIGATERTSSITLYAKWTVITYTITYNINGGTGTMTPTTYTVETPDFNLPTPTKSGYTFKGWYSNGSFSGTTTSKITKGSTGNRIYYAKWEGNACTITVVANPSDLTSRLSGGGNYKNGDSITITAPPKYDAYKFENWTKNGSVISTSETYTFTANGNETYVANFIDNRESAVFRVHVLDDTYVETSLCEVEIKYGDLDNPNQNSIKRSGNTDIEIDGPNSIISVTKTHISGTNILDKCGVLTSQVFYKFPTSINNEPFINILYNGNVVESEYLYTNTSETFDVYYGKLPKPSTGGGGSNPGGGTDTGNEEITVRFKYYLDDIEIDTSNGSYISWPASNIDELKCYWFKYDGTQEREEAISGSTDRINFTYISEYYGDPANSTPITNLKSSLEIQAPGYTHLASPTFLSGVNIHNTNDTYTYANCPTNILDICIYFTSYEFNAYVDSNLPAYGDAYIGRKGIKQAPFYASSVNPTTLVFNAEVLNNAYEFNRWVSDDETRSELSKSNPWTISHPKGQDYYVEAEFTGKKIRVALNPLNGKSELFWQYVGIIAGTNEFQRLSFDATEDIKHPDDKNRSGYEFLGWYTNMTPDGFGGKGSGYLIIDTNGNLQPNVPGWTTSDGLWIKGPDEVSPDLITNVDVEVYAKWEPIEYTITYKNLKGAVNPPENPSKYTYESPTITFVKPTENLPRGYTWKYWDPESIRYCSVHNRIITACWETNKYTLTWDLNGGTVTKAGTCAPLDSTGVVSGQVEYLSSIIAPIVSKNGYKFEGWSANGVDVITPTTTMPVGDVKYIAVYSKKTYQITVNDDPALDKVYIKVNGENRGTTTTCTTEDEITLIAENTVEYVLDYWKKSGGSIVSGNNEFTFTANDTLLDNAKNNIFTAYYKEDPSATLKINFIVDDYIEKTAILKFNTTFNFLGKSGTEGYMCEIQGEPKCLEGDIDINQQGFFFIPSKYNEKDICMVPHEYGTGTTELICSNKGNTIGRDGYNSQYYQDNTAKNRYCPIGFEWQAYLPTNVADETHLVFPAAEKEKYGILYGPLVIDVYYGKTPERFLPVIPDDVEITTVSGLTLLQRIQNKIATFKWLNNLFGEPEKSSWDAYDNSGIKSFLSGDSKETPLSVHCIEYGDLQIYNQNSGNVNTDKTIKQYSLTLDNIIKPLNGQVILDVSKIVDNKIYFNISNSTGFTNTSDGIYVYFSANNETNENNATLYKMKLPKTASSKGLLLTIPGISNIESLYIYRTPIMVDSSKAGIMPKIHFNSEKEELPISVYDRTTLNIVI